MINRIKNPHQADILLLSQPQKIADWESMGDMVHKAVDAGQSMETKTWVIKLLYGILKYQENLSEIDYNILNENMRDYPELAPEIRKRYPHIEFTGDMPLFDSSS
ncbi:MAG: hypothetical protein AAF731_06070 [Bacteroidota bacterium]